MRTRTKICGITRLADALCAIDAGVDALGFVFVKKSPRYISPNAARSIISQLPPLVTMVGLFMDNHREEVASVLSDSKLDLLQFHGEEPVEFCESWGSRYIKSVPMGGGNLDTDPLTYASRYPSSIGFLLDSNALGESGGSGKLFDWSRIPGQLLKPIVVAGGLDPDNVMEAVTTLKPYAVDVSSGVESEKGIKDHKKMIAFINAVNEGNRANEINS